METSPRNSYPRALPFRAADDGSAEAERRRDAMRDRLEDLAIQAGRLRRWTYALGLALAGAVIVAVTSTVLLVQRTSTPVATNAASEPTPPLAALPPAKPAQSASRPEPANRDATLEAMGGLSAANLYQSYLAVGLLADGVQHKAFTVDGAANTLKIIGNCLTLVESKLAALDRRNLDPDDIASLQQIETVTALMRIQTQALDTYWKTGKAAHGEAYQRSRRATWAALSKVLGLGPMPPSGL